METFVRSLEIDREQKAQLYQSILTGLRASYVLNGPVEEEDNTTIEVIGSGETLHLEPRHEVKHTTVSYAKSVSILGYEDKTSLEDGLRIMWEWAKEQPMREQKVWNEYELEKGIYSFWK
jgi:UDP-glucose 4-epimerase